MNTVNLSPANQTLVQKPIKTENTSNKIKKEENKSSNKAFIVASACIAAAGIATLAIRGKLKANKAKKIAQETAEQLRKNEALDKIFKEIKCLNDPFSQSGEVMTVDTLFARYLHDYPTDNITFYHGTGMESAKRIQKDGFMNGFRGLLAGNFDGVYLTESQDVAQKYAAQKIGHPMQCYSSIIESEGAVVKSKIPNGKLAQFTTDEGKFTHYAILSQILEKPEIKRELTEQKLNSKDLIKFFEKKLTDLGYDGIRTFDAHTGATPVIFNYDKIKVEEIIK